MKTDEKNIFEKLVVHFSGQENTAKALGVRQPSVSGWVRGSKKMSVDVAIRAEKATKGEFKAIDLCPKLKKFQMLSA